MGNTSTGRTLLLVCFSTEGQLDDVHIHLANTVVADSSCSPCRCSSSSGWHRVCWLMHLALFVKANIVCLLFVSCTSLHMLFFFLNKYLKLSYFVISIYVILLVSFQSGLLLFVFSFYRWEWDEQRLANEPGVVVVNKEQKKGKMIEYKQRFQKASIHPFSIHMCTNIHQCHLMSVKSLQNGQNTTYPSLSH